MRHTAADTRAGGLSRWPRVLFLGAAAFALAVLIGEVVYGWAVNQTVFTGDSADAVGAGIFAGMPGCILALLAAPGEANPWRTTGIWITLLAYVGFVCGFSLVGISGAIWLAHGGNTFDAAYDPAPTGSVYSVAAGLFLAGNICVVPALLLGIPASLYTLWAYWQQPHHEKAAASLREERPARGLEVGAAVAAAVLVLLAPAVATVADPSLSLESPALPTVLRLVLFELGMVLAVVLVIGGLALDLRGTGWNRQGRVLSWIGATVLITASLLDSWTGTSLSDTTGRYSARDAADPIAYGGVLDHWVGAGSFVLPAATVALLLVFVAWSPAGRGA